MKEETRSLSDRRLEEGYDCDTDEFYMMWSKLKKMTISEAIAE